MSSEDTTHTLYRCKYCGKCRLGRPNFILHTKKCPDRKKKTAPQNGSYRSRSSRSKHTSAERAGRRQAASTLNQASPSTSTMGSEVNCQSPSTSGISSSSLSMTISSIGDNSKVNPGDASRESREGANVNLGDHLISADADTTEDEEVHSSTATVPDTTTGTGQQGQALDQDGAGAAGGNNGDAYEFQDNMDTEDSTWFKITGVHSLAAEPKRGILHKSGPLNTITPLSPPWLPNKKPKRSSSKNLKAFKAPGHRQEPETPPVAATNPFDCTICGHQFSRIADLYTHCIWSHTGEFHLCTSCNYEFKIREIMYRPDIPNNVQCPRSQCGFYFKPTEATLRRRAHANTNGVEIQSSYGGSWSSRSSDSFEPPPPLLSPHYSTKREIQAKNPPRQLQEEEYVEEEETFDEEVLAGKKLVCEECGYRVGSQRRFDTHQLNHHHNKMVSKVTGSLIGSTNESKAPEADSAGQVEESGGNKLNIFNLKL